jgi:type I restriction enzyme S subunit
LKPSISSLRTSATGQIGWIDDFLFDEELLLLGEDGAPFFDPRKNKAYIIRGKSWVNNHAHVLRAKDWIASNPYLCYYLNNFRYDGYVSGTTRPKLNQAPMRRIPVRLAPLNEQKRIVSKIEELFTKLDAGIEYLKKILVEVKQYRQSVLKAAFEGKLTEEWRSRQLFEPQEATDDPLPVGWRWVTLGQIASPWKERYKPSESSGERFVGLEHIESGTGRILGEGDSSSLKSTKTRFNCGDVLYGRLRPYLNKVWVAIFNGVCSTDILVFPKSSSYDSRYLARFISTPDFVRYATQNMKGVQHPRISFQSLSEYRIPFPTLVEQKEIVQRVERFLSLCDETETSIRGSLSQAAKLRQAILRRAFSGSLVPQDPSDEPAQRLLERTKLHEVPLMNPLKTN